MKKKTWKDITLEKYMDYISIKSEDNLELIVGRLSVLLDKSIDEIESMPYEELIKYSNDYIFILDIPKPKLHKRITIGKNIYEFVNLSKISTGQMLDIEEYVKDGLEKNLHNIIAILYMPVVGPIYKRRVCKYGEIEHKVIVDDMLKLDMDIFYSTLLFFWSTVQIYTKGLNCSLKEQMMKEKIQQDPILVHPEKEVKQE